MKGMMEKFVAIDVETTGLDKEKNEIIEIGAAKFINGELVDKFSQLVSIEGEIPEDVIRITGITNKDLRGKPKIEEVQEDFNNFIQNFLLVGHNISFDIGFLEKCIEIKNPVVDTLELSHILLPFVKNHSLTTIADYLGINVQVAHRAYEDAMNSGKILLKLLEIIENMHPDILFTISEILDINHPLYSIFHNAIDVSVKKGMSRKSYPFPFPVNVRIPEIEKKVIINKKINTYFENELIQKREVQVKMAEAVRENFANGRFLIIEAGTGAGKSLGYLIPSIIESYENEKPVYISTYTKNLQDQIFNKDIPLSEKITEIPVKTVILKGKNNYLCLKKLKSVLKEGNKIFTRREKVSISTVYFWSNLTKTGDITEITSYLEPGIWELFQVDETCSDRECPLYNQCYYKRIKKEEETANIVLVNHHLFFSGDSKGEIVVFDEAHELDNAITNSISIKSGLSNIRFILTEIKWQLKRDKKNTKEIDAIISDIYRISLEYGEEFLKENPYGRGFFNHIPTNNIVEILDRIEKLTKKLDRYEVLKKMCEMLEESINNFRFILKQEDETFCYFAEVPRNKPEAIRFVAAPIDISSYFQEKAESVFHSLVFTSATIKMGNSFDFFLKTLGLNKFPERTHTVDLGDIFPFEKQVMAIIPSHFPFPSEKRFIKEVVKFIGKNILKLGKGTLVLFTSYQYLNDSYEDISNMAKNLGISCYAQNISGSKDSILKSFKDEFSSILLGTGSFWQGIDVPGKALEILIIPKIPFPNMSDPIIVSRIKYLRKKGVDPFYNYQVPLAVMKYRQGFGRLIRTFSDRGVFIILDTRILVKEYGKIFIDSIPVPLHIVDSYEKIVEMIQDWLR